MMRIEVIKDTNDSRSIMMINNCNNGECRLLSYYNDDGDNYHDDVKMMVLIIIMMM
jgi:hypothetical protein